MKINLWGQVLGETGYSVHTKNIALALVKRGIDLGIEAGNLPVDWKSKIDVKLHKAVEKQHLYEATIGITLIDWIPMKSGDRLPVFCPYGIFEGDKVPHSWAENVNSKYVTELWTPSEHTRQAFLNGGVTNPIHIMPHGINPGVFNPDAEKLPEFPDDCFKFLYVGGWSQGVNDRKGLDIALRAFVAEFKPTEKVKFLAKVNTAYAPLNVIINNMQALGLPDAPNRPEILLLHDTLTEGGLARLYKSADCFVMPSKGEAFCMPCAESMATGVPVITTNYGGQTDYVNSKNGFLINVEKMIPATDANPIYHSTKWALPSQKHLQELMRYAFDNQKETKRKGKKASKQVLKNYTWDKTADKIVRRMKVLGMK